MARSCSNCRYYLPAESQCRASPPVLRPDGEQVPYPKVRFDHVCAWHKRLPVQAGERGAGHGAPKVWTDKRLLSVISPLIRDESFAMSASEIHHTILGMQKVSMMPIHTGLHRLLKKGFLVRDAKTRFYHLNPKAPVAAFDVKGMLVEAEQAAPPVAPVMEVE